jgi:carbon storage regulator CsrA
MLVLSRKVGQRIHVGDDIVLEIRRISGNRVTLALEAPRNVRILRGELERAAREFDEPAPSPDPPGQADLLPNMHFAGQMQMQITSPALDRDYAI